MLKVFCLLFIISNFNFPVYSRNIIEYVPVVLHVVLNNYTIQPGNDFIVEKDENGLIEWKRNVTTGPDGLQIFFIDEENKIEHSTDDMCDTERMSYTFGEVLRGLLGIYFCPISKWRLSLIASEFSIPKESRKDVCSKPKSAVMKLFSKKEHKLVMTFRMDFYELRVHECKK
ncbi:uncharacterized protein LOC127288691 [Leptopilina boulardi]|uniref:uncharacterized protein LOC127288691 n=1 Tax=Leptopilina boulardi TaxID=63433 RepID=UPI0021F613E5|nr:uncharacterized protein LOC127288691 [Leptopilina boulardi]